MDPEFHLKVFLKNLRLFADSTSKNVSKKAIKLPDDPSKISLKNLRLVGSKSCQKYLKKPYR